MGQYDTTVKPAAAKKKSKKRKDLTRNDADKMRNFVTTPDIRASTENWMEQKSPLNSQIDDKLKGIHIVSPTCSGDNLKSTSNDVTLDNQNTSRVFVRELPQNIKGLDYLQKDQEFVTQRLRSINKKLKEVRGVESGGIRSRISNFNDVKNTSVKKRRKNNQKSMGLSHSSERGEKLPTINMQKISQNDSMVFSPKNFSRESVEEQLSRRIASYRNQLMHIQSQSTKSRKKKIKYDLPTVNTSFQDSSRITCR